MLSLLELLMTQQIKQKICFKYIEGNTKYLAIKGMRGGRGLGLGGGVWGRLSESVRKFRYYLKKKVFVTSFPFFKFSHQVFTSGDIIFHKFLNFE